MVSSTDTSAAEYRNALIAHRRRMGMIPSSKMPATRELDDDCGCGGKKIPNGPTAYKPRGTKTPEFADYKVKHAQVPRG
jgi:hypothetical protein